MKQEECVVCYRVICKKCRWEATDDDILLIQKGDLIACPKCGWKPGEAF